MLLCGVSMVLAMPQETIPFISEAEWENFFFSGDGSRIRMIRFKNGTMRLLPTGNIITRLSSKQPSATPQTKCTPANAEGCSDESDIASPTKSQPSIEEPTKPFAAPKCAKDGQTFCIDVDEYPTQLVEQILKRDPLKYQELFGSDLEIQDIGQRINDGDDEQPLCRSQSRVIFPKVGQTESDSWKFIVNYQNATQGIKVEICDKPNRPCEMTNGFPSSYQTLCRQKYIYRQLLSLDEYGNTVKEQFKFPGCCQCVVRHRRTGRWRD